LRFSCDDEGEENDEEELDNEAVLASPLTISIFSIAAVGTVSVGDDERSDGEEDDDDDDDDPPKDASSLLT